MRALSVPLALLLYGLLLLLALGLFLSEPIL